MPGNFTFQAKPQQNSSIKFKLTTSDEANKIAAEEAARKAKEDAEAKKAAEEAAAKKAADEAKTLEAIREAMAKKNPVKETKKFKLMTSEEADREAKKKAAEEEDVKRRTAEEEVKRKAAREEAKRKADEERAKKDLEEANVLKAIRKGTLKISVNKPANKFKLVSQEEATKKAIEEEARKVVEEAIEAAEEKIRKAAEEKIKAYMELIKKIKNKELAKEITKGQANIICQLINIDYTYRKAPENRTDYFELLNKIHYIYAKGIESDIKEPEFFFYAAKLYTLLDNRNLALAVYKDGIMKYNIIDRELYFQAIGIAYHIKDYDSLFLLYERITTLKELNKNKNDFFNKANGILLRVFKSVINTILININTNTDYRAEINRIFEIAKNLGANEKNFIDIFRKIFKTDNYILIRAAMEKMMEFNIGIEAIINYPTLNNKNNMPAGLSDNFNHSLLINKMYESLQNSVEAIKKYEEALKSTTPIIRNTSIYAQNIKGAIRAYRSVVKSETLILPCYFYNAIEAYYSLGKYKEVLELYEKFMTYAEGYKVFVEKIKQVLKQIIIPGESEKEIKNKKLAFIREINFLGKLKSKEEEGELLEQFDSFERLNIILILRYALPAADKTLNYKYIFEISEKIFKIFSKTILPNKTLPTDNRILLTSLNKSFFVFAANFTKNQKDFMELSKVCYKVIDLYKLIFTNSNIFTDCIFDGLKMINPLDKASENYELIDSYYKSKKNPTLYMFEKMEHYYICREFDKALQIFDNIITNKKTEKEVNKDLLNLALKTSYELAELVPIFKNVNKMIEVYNSIMIYGKEYSIDIHDDICFRLYQNKVKMLCNELGYIVTEDSIKNTLFISEANYNSDPSNVNYWQKLLKERRRQGIDLIKSLTKDEGSNFRLK